MIQDVSAEGIIRLIYMYIHIYIYHTVLVHQSSSSPLQKPASQCYLKSIQRS
jgi:hypothetical protein